MRRIVALLIGALLVGSAGAAAEQDYVDAEPAPVGQAAPLDPGQVTVAVLDVLIDSDATAVMDGLSEADRASGYAGVVIDLELTSEAAGPVEISRALDYRIVDASGREWGTPSSIGRCDGRDTTWVWAGNLRPGRTATITVCFAAPGDQLDGAHLEIRWRDGGRFLPFALAPAPIASPVASPAAGYRSQRAQSREEQTGLVTRPVPLPCAPNARGQ